LEKGYWEKLLEEHPESEKVIKDSLGYQLEQLRKTFDELFKPINTMMGSILTWPERQLSKLGRR